MQKEDKTTTVITGTKVQLIASIMGIAASILGLVLEYFGDKDYWLFVFLLVINAVFFITTLNQKSNN